MSFPMKIVLIGDQRKSEILQYYGDVYRSDITFIAVVDLAFKAMNIGGNTFNFQVWQLSLDPSYESERRRYYYGALGTIIVLDVNNLEDYQNIPLLLEEIWTYNGIGKVIPIVIAGINIQERKKISDHITDEEIKRFVNEINGKHQASIEYIPIDERTGGNIAQIWEKFGEWYIRYLQQFES
ncbi:MAG: hypothetical protein ACFFB5_07935 [Promethearchaeota archaeon]